MTNLKLKIYKEYVIHKYINMNRFMYLSRRKFSNDIKSLYPKCVNCFNFNDSNKTCEKFVINQNYVDNKSEYELALDVRNDNTKCGEEGKLFNIGKEELEKTNLQLFGITCTMGLSTGIISSLTTEKLLVVPMSIISFIYLISFANHSRICEIIINNEKKRIEDYNKFLSKSKE